MGKKLVVKIATPKVIKALEEALDRLEKSYKTQDENNKKYQKQCEAWQKDLAKLAVSAISKAEEISASTRYNGSVSVSFQLPAGSIKVPDEPKRDFDTLHEWQYKEQREEIENALRMLKMTDDEVVPASTLGSISKYL